RHGDFRALSHHRQTLLESRRQFRAIDGLDEKLPNLRHRFQRPPAQRIDVHRHAPPAHDTTALALRCVLYRGTSVAHRMGCQESESKPEILWKLDALLFCAGPEKILRKRGEQARAIPAGTVRIDTTAMR